MSIITILIASIVSVTGISSCWDSHDENWDELAPLLAANGYDTVFYMASNSHVTDDEGLKECLDACLPLGIDVHARVVIWKTGNRMNPTDPRNVELLAGICLRIAAEYPVAGIHLDYIGYEYCLSGFPENARGMTDALHAVRDSLNKINRVVKLSVSVMPHECEMLLFGEKWNKWLELGLLDLVVSMNYTESDSQFVVWGEDQLELAGDKTILCGILEPSSYTELTERTLNQIALAEDMGFDGWVIYHLCDEVVERCLRFYNSDPGN